MEINEVNYDTVMTIDPGSNGSIIVWRNNLLKSVNMPRNIGQLTDYFEYYATISKKTFVAIERQSLWTGDLRVELDQEDDEDYKKILEAMIKRNREQAAKVYRLQKLFENYTQIKMLIEQKRFDYLPISPISWQSRLGLIIRDREVTDTEKKNRHKEMAQTYFKTIHITHKNADALLILYFLHHVSKTDKRWFYNTKDGKCRIIYSEKSIIG